MPKNNSLIHKKTNLKKFQKKNKKELLTVKE